MARQGEGEGFDNRRTALKVEEKFLSLEINYEIEKFRRWNKMVRREIFASR